MKEVRITFRGEDFAIVSQSMIELGVSFQVEPVEPEGEDDAAAPAAAERRPPARKKPKRVKRGSAVARAPESPRAAAREPTGADRLKAMVERNRITPVRPQEENGGSVQVSEAPGGEES